MTVLDNNAIVVNFPNYIGDEGRYDLRDQRAYFSQFDGGVSYVFQLALEHVIDGDLLSFHKQCEEYRDNHYHELFQYGQVNLAHYYRDRKEFQRRIFDIYRYAKTSLAALGNVNLLDVKRLSTNRNFDTASFLVKMC